MQASEPERVCDVGDDGFVPVKTLTGPNPVWRV